MAKLTPNNFYKCDGYTPLYKKGKLGAYNSSLGGIKEGKIFYVVSVVADGYRDKYIVIFEDLIGEIQTFASLSYTLHDLSKETEVSP